MPIATALTAGLSLWKRHGRRDHRRRGGRTAGREIGRGGGYYSYRRGNGTTGAIVGVPRALIGREIGRRC
jgi:hypothetical protein